MKKALIVTTVSGFVPQFEMNNVKILQSLGYEVHYATNYNTPVYGIDNSRLDNTGIVRHQIDFVRSPFQIRLNIKAYYQLKRLIIFEKYTLIHCHTPMGGVLGRIAAKATKTSPVIYTAHGFHFFKGAPFRNWVLFYPMERYLAKFTDVLITINKEDYQIGKKFKIRKNGFIKFIKGIGINTDLGYNNKINKIEKHQELGVRNGSFLMTSVGELTRRKNHKVIIQALAKIANIDVTYLICGSGVMENELKELVRELGLDQKVIFAGYRNDIVDILKASDCFVFPSLQEGLPVALLEAMSVGLPVICSRIRGNTDLIVHNKGGYLIDPFDDKAYANTIEKMFMNNQNRNKFGEYNRKRVKEYDIKAVGNKMERIYKFFADV